MSIPAINPPPCHPLKWLFSQTSLFTTLERPVNLRPFKPDTGAVKKKPHYCRKRSFFLEVLTNLGIPSYFVTAGLPTYFKNLSAATFMSKSINACESSQALTKAHFTPPRPIDLLPTLDDLRASTIFLRHLPATDRPEWILRQIRTGTRMIL